MLFLNPDAAPDPGCLEALVGALDHEAMSWRSSGRASLDPTDRSSAPSGPSRRRPDRGRRRWGSTGWPAPRRAEGFVVGACLLSRRAVVEAVGGFDESYWLYGEEADLQLRAVRVGGRAELVPEATCRHVGGASSVPDDPTVFEHFQRGTERFLLQHRGRGSLLSHRLALLTGSVIRVLLLTLTGRGRSSTARTRRRIARRLVRTLGRTPLSLPDEAPAVALPQLVVLSLEPWDDVWRRNQLLVRELLQLDPHLEVLFVEPPLDVLHHVRTERRWPRLATRPPRWPGPAGRSVSADEGAAASPRAAGRRHAPAIAATTDSERRLRRTDAVGERPGVRGRDRLALARPVRPHRRLDRRRATRPHPCPNEAVGRAPHPRGGRGGGLLCRARREPSDRVTSR